MKWIRWLGSSALALLFVGCADGTGEHSLGVRPTRDPLLSGAIFTTLRDGTRVNANHFECQRDVYLDGGPPNQAPSTSAALPEGDYYFQVTDPSGRDLLSNDPIECRSFHINEDGLIDDADPENDGCGHMTGIDADHGALTVQLFPFDVTPNPGGVYKVWVTRVEDYDPLPGCTGPACEGVAPGNWHGFHADRSKTDNFKAGVCPERKGDIKACKKKVTSIYPLAFDALPNWPITLLDDRWDVVDEGYTGEDGCIVFEDLPPGTYFVREPDSLMVGSFLWTPFEGDATKKEVNLSAGELEVVVFKNICICNYDTNRECTDVKHADRLCPPSADPPPPYER